MTAGDGIDGFVKRLSWRFRAWTVGLTLAGHGLLAAVVLLLVDLLPASLRRPFWIPAWIAAAAWLAGVFVWTLLRTRVPLARADRELGLQDRLLTYVRLDAARRGQAAGRWLGEDLEGRLAGLPPERVRILVQRPLGALRYLVPLLVLLLLLRTFAPLQPPRLPAPDSAPPMAGGPDPERPGEQPGEDQEQRQQPPPVARAPEPEPEPEKPAPPPPEQPPRPILDLPTRDAFTIPQFIGDGPTRRELARLAELERGPEAAAGTPPPTQAGRTEDPPPDPAAEFRRAAEAALRARFVPPHERPFVRRYFEALVERAK